ncbi:hypothetical protein ACF0H5_017085 [Mactra antiquata]
MSLVADYGTDSESDSGDDARQRAEQVQSVDVQVVATKRNYLVTNEEDLTDSDDDNKRETQSSSSNHERLPNPLGEKLPTPAIGSGSETNATKGTEGPGSVFANPFENAEMAKQSILEKHVKMTEAQLMTGKRAKICKSFKLGKCRFGKHCKYSHDLDSNLSLRYTSTHDVCGTEDQQDSSTPANIPKHLRLPPPPKQGFMGTIDSLKSDNRPPSTYRQRQQYSQQVRYMQSADGEDNDDDKFNVGDKRKKRVGVSQSLVPPKKAMSNLNKQRQSERPWTMNR